MPDLRIMTMKAFEGVRDGRRLDYRSVVAGTRGLAYRLTASRRFPRLGLRVRRVRHGARADARGPRARRRVAAALRRRIEAAHQDAAALRSLGHGGLASSSDRHHRRCGRRDRRLALAGLGARFGRQLRLLEHRARGEGARRQSRVARGARPRRDRHSDRPRRRGRRAARVRQHRDAVAVRGAAAAPAVRAARDRLGACALRPRRAARAVRRRARDRRRRSVRARSV